ncbi:hypothetical protein JTE90_004553 [Oedothorax gibbosus]|uniref:Rubicon Homology domain-containing protein n=1 Tax=Oedothorax gibbosus TaxID=931172 RepID=A0AAV6UMB6_9ARAC|nr:hypothetical protein JTE90_004553 [Oedothorax gibbosus]
MPLESSVEVSASVKSGVRAKSPKHKKRRSGLVKCSLTDEEKILKSKEIDAQRLSTALQLESTMKNKCFEEFESPVFDDIPNAFLEKSAKRTPNVTSNCNKQSKFKRSFSLPIVFNEHFNDFSTRKNSSWPSSSIEVSEIPLKLMALQSSDPANTTDQNPQIYTSTMSNLSNSSSTTLQSLSPINASSNTTNPHISRTTLSNLSNSSSTTLQSFSLVKAAFKDSEPQVVPNLNEEINSTTLQQMNDSDSNKTSNPPIDSTNTSGLIASNLNQNSTDEHVNNESVSRRSSTSTVRERNDSIGSTFSQISISEVKEIEESMKTETQSRNIDTKWAARHARSKSDASCDFERLENIDEVFSLPSSFSEKSHPKRKSIFEGKQMVVPTECFFPRPQQGQSLQSFFSSNEFNISAELDRENAHFRISEALIAAIEHMKFTRTMKMAEEDEESDEEIRKLTQRIRIRRRERQREKTLRKTVKSLVLLSDGKTDTTSLSASPPVSSHSSDFEVDSIGSEEEFDDFELSTRTDSNLSSMKDNGLSLSMASLYSDADLQKAHLRFKDADKSSSFHESDTNNLSAESVALSLIRRFSEKHLPKASDLQWLVSEQETKQKLLPLPNSWPISPDTIEEEYIEKTRLRGNFEWAPPRPQIIFIILPTLKRKDIMERQKFRCAGCGMKIEKKYVSRFRYCNYFGKYFCQCCHNNNLAYIPGRILWKWDFTKHYVSKFAYELLDQMYSDPLFNVEDINVKLYQKVRQLDQCRLLRKQLFHLKDFMITCRKAEGIQDLLDKQHPHMTHEPHMYSLGDLVQVKAGDLVKHLRYLVNPCLEHIKQCLLCQAKGFICEICGKDKDIIFTFQLDRVVVCQVCGSCFHRSCFRNIRCPRCVRIDERKKRVQQEKSAAEIFE